MTKLCHCYVAIPFNKNGEACVINSCIKLDISTVSSAQTSSKKHGCCQSCPRHKDQKVDHRCTLCREFVCGFTAQNQWITTASSVHWNCETMHEPTAYTLYQCLVVNMTHPYISFQTVQASYVFGLQFCLFFNTMHIIHLVWLNYWFQYRFPKYFP